MKKQPNLADIKLLILDVDGVLTDGTVVVNDDATETKFFNTLDGHGLRMWRRAGLKVAFLSGRASQAAECRARELGVDYVFQNCHEKLPVVEKLLRDLGLSPAQAACIGDDLPDLPVMRYVGFAAAVANAVDEVKQQADYLTAHPGGSGAVREVVEYILKNAGKWQELMKRYLP
ncbi:MAG: KdsC family phosphatase [Planctomycetota bacterium]|jgi:3-deoxy-D-manno-octulosonate 8-phosphate phosphatase (KDO 8-P phosphatase)